MKTFIFTLALSFSMSSLAATEGYRSESSALGDIDSIPQEEVENRVRESNNREFGYDEAVNDIQREDDYGREQRAEDIRIPESEVPGMDHGQFGDDVQREEDIIEVDGFSDDAYQPIGEDQIEINN